MDTLGVAAVVVVVLAAAGVWIARRRRPPAQPPPDPLDLVRNPTMLCPRCGRTTAAPRLPASYQEGAGSHPHLRCQHCHAIIG